MADVRFTPVRPKRAYEYLVEEIEDAVLSGDLKPGEHLPSERDLREQFDVSRATVREALRVLESHGLVQSRAGDPRGPKVLPISPVPLLKSMERLASAPHVGLAAVLEFRIVLESAAAFLAADNRTDDDLRILRATVDDLSAAAEIGDLDGFSRADIAFHEYMAAAGGNLLIQVSNQAVREVSLELITKKLTGSLGDRDLMRSWVERHTALLTAIAERDGVLAASLVGQDLVDNYAPYVADPEQRLLHLLAKWRSDAGTASA